MSIGSLKHDFTHLIEAAGVALALCGESAQADAPVAEVQSGWPQGTIANAVDVPSIQAGHNCAVASAAGWAIPA